jgi:hypothetical protein
MGKTIEELRQEYNNLNRRGVVALGPDGSQTAEHGVPPLSDPEGGPATEEELTWFRETHPGRPVSEADGPIRARRQWRAFWGADAAKYGW